MAVVNTLCAPVGLNPFAGGKDDGLARNSLINTSCSPVGLNPFSGGRSDGHAGFSILVWDPMNCLALLPISLLYFDAVPNERKVYLDWSTSSEINNDYFTVERSRDTMEWEKVVIVEGAGFSDVQLNYHSVDYEPYSGLSYYRLKQTDFDGQFEYSGIRAVNIDTDKHIVRIYPNPANDRFYIVAPEGTDYRVNILDAYGKIVFADSNSKEISTLNFSNGMYVVRINFIGGETTMLKLIVNK
jgi:hypothetical protein